MVFWISRLWQVRVGSSQEERCPPVPLYAYLLIMWVAEAPYHGPIPLVREAFCGTECLGCSWTEATYWHILTHYHPIAMHAMRMMNRGAWGQPPWFWCLRCIGDFVDVYMFYVFCLFDAYILLFLIFAQLLTLMFSAAQALLDNSTRIHGKLHPMIAVTWFRKECQSNYFKRIMLLYIYIYCTCI